jgi:hypothetical protein
MADYRSNAAVAGGLADEASKKIADAGYHDVFAFEAGDGPDPGDSPANNAVAFANRALRELHTRAKELEANPFVTPEGRERELLPLQAKVKATITESRDIAARAVAQQKVDEDRLWAPPALDRADLVGQRTDERLCDWFDTLSADQVAVIEAEMAKGERRDLVEALARSPIPGKGKSVGQTHWRAAVERENGPKVRALASQRRVAEWSVFSLLAMARVAMTDPWAGRSPESLVDKLTRGHLGRKTA